MTAISCFFLTLSIVFWVAGGSIAMTKDMYSLIELTRAGLCFILAALMVIAAGVWR